jgi:hypothetical protein
MISMVLLKHGKNGGITVYVPKETMLKEIAAKMKLNQHFFFDLVWELSDGTSYIIRQFTVIWNCSYKIEAERCHMI